MRRHVAWKCFGLLVTLAVSAPGVLAGILSPAATYGGRTYNEWQVRWWQTALSIPVVNSAHPLLSGGSFGGENGVLFLAPGAGPFDLTISSATALFLPVVNVECSVLEPAPFHGDDESSLRDCANGHLNATSGRFAVIDGVPVNDLNPFRFESPLFQFGPLPADNFFEVLGLNAPAGTMSDAVDAGFYILLAPISVGQHVVRVGGTFDDFNFSLDTTYNINVVTVPEPASVILLVSGALGLFVYGRRRQKTHSTKPC